MPRFLIFVADSEIRASLKGGSAAFVSDLVHGIMNDGMDADLNASAGA